MKIICETILAGQEMVVKSWVNIFLKYLDMIVLDITNLRTDDQEDYGAVA